MKRISILPDIIELKFGLQSRVESSWLLTTRVGERRLCDSVVLWVEVEDNLVSNTCRLEGCVSECTLDHNEFYLRAPQE